MIDNRCLLLTTMWVFTCCAYAETEETTPTHPVDKAYELCLEQDYSTADMVKCSRAAETDWDAELNKVYQALMAELEQAAQESLRQAQRDWIDFRDAEYKSIADIYTQLEGTMWQIVAADARAEVIKRRTLSLQTYLDSFSEPLF